MNDNQRKDIMRLKRIADAYCDALNIFGKYKALEEVQNLLGTINDQQSEELKEAKCRLSLTWLS